jgi:hypothetical protein
VIEARQRADHVPYVRADSEFRHTTDVDGYFHSLNLTIGDEEDTENSPRSNGSTTQTFRRQPTEESFAPLLRMTILHL